LATAIFSVENHTVTWTEKGGNTMTEYDDVKVIKTGKVGLVVEVKDGRYLVDFGNAKKWFDDCDLLLVEQEDNED